MVTRFLRAPHRRRIEQSQTRTRSISASTSNGTLRQWQDPWYVFCIWQVNGKLADFVQLAILSDAIENDS
ncbi:MAG: hypothetical protein AAF704_10485 [Cyanobacteria bacterium P01_D01_bin.123]